MNTIRLLMIVVILNANKKKLQILQKRMIKVKMKKVFVNSNHNNSWKSLYHILQQYIHNIKFFEKNEAFKRKR